jgi:hypothetical protein
MRYFQKGIFNPVLLLGHPDERLSPTAKLIGAGVQKNQCRIFEIRSRATEEMAANPMILNSLSSR